MSLDRMTLHQMWMDREVDDNISSPDKYPHYHTYTRQWHVLNPSMTYMFWNRQRVHALWEHPELQPWADFYHRGLQHYMEKCDFSRYAILYIYGGLYVDLDMIPLQPIRPLLEGRHWAWAYESPHHQQRMDHGHRRLSNAFLYSTPRHPLWPKLMTYIQTHYDPHQHVLLNTGPTLLSRFARAMNLDDSYFVDQCQVLPLDDQGQTSCDMTQAYCMTRWHEGTGWAAGGPSWQQRCMESLPIIVPVLALGLLALWRWRS